MPGVLCPTFSARQKKFRVGTIELFMSGVLCRAFSAEQKKSECGHNAAFLQNFFYAEQKVGDQNILNAGIKSQRFSLFQAMRGHRAIGYCVILLYFVIFEIQRPQFYNFNKMLKIVARLAKFLGR